MKNGCIFTPKHNNGVLLENIFKYGILILKNVGLTFSKVGLQFQEHMDEPNTYFIHLSSANDWSYSYSYLLGISTIKIESNRFLLKSEWLVFVDNIRLNDKNKLIELWHTEERKKLGQIKITNIPFREHMVESNVYSILFILYEAHWSYSNK